MDTKCSEVQFQFLRVRTLMLEDRRRAETPGMGNDEDLRVPCLAVKVRVCRDGSMLTESKRVSKYELLSEEGNFEKLEAMSSMEDNAADLGVVSRSWISSMENRWRYQSRCIA